MMRSIPSLITGCILVCAAPGAVGAQEREQPPAPMPVRPWEFPKVNQFTLANGVKIVVVERTTLPLVSTRLIVDAGSAREPVARNGIAALTARLLREGSANLTGEQIAERIESLGAELATGATYDAAFVDLTAMKSAFGDAFALAATMLTEPTFPAREVERLRAEAIANYEQSQATVEGLAAEAFVRAVFDTTASISRPVTGTSASLRRIERDQIVGWHRAQYTPRALTVLLVGSITVAEARQLAERAFGAWRATGAPPVLAVPAAQLIRRSRVILIDRPGSVQSAIHIGEAVPPATDSLYLAMVALNRVLGGGFNGRVNMNLREKRGYTYGAFSGLDLRRGTGMLAVTSAVRSDATDSALVEAVGEYQRIAREAIPESELRDATANVAGSFPSGVQTVQNLRNRMQNLLVWGLPLDYYATYRERLQRVTPAEAQRAAQRHLAPDALVIVVAGDLSKIEAPVRQRNLGDVEVWDATGRRIR
jgi:zinc protease